MIITPWNRFDYNSDPASVNPPDYVVTFNGRVGEVELTDDDITEALGYVPASSVAAANWGGITGTLADQSDLVAALAAKQAAGSYANAVHTHVIADVTGLQTALDGKQPTGSYLVAADLASYATTSSVTTGLSGKENTIAAGTTAQYWRGDKSWQTLDKSAVGLGNVDNTADSAKSVASAATLTTARTINGVSFNGSANITINAVDSTARVPTTRTITTTAPLTGGGDLSANRTLAISAATTAAAGSMSAADKTKLDAITGTNTGDETKSTIDTKIGVNGTTTEFYSRAGTWLTPAGSGSGLTDGDKGDITVSGTGATWTIDNGVVSLAKMADMATASVIYRKTAGTGAPEVQSLATLKTDLGLTGTNSGDQTTITGNAGTATTLQTSRNFSISGSGITAAAQSFNGSANVVLAASVDNGHITLARMADVATGTVFYRKTAGTGAPEVQTLATLKTDLGLTGTNSGDQTTITGNAGTATTLQNSRNFSISGGGITAGTQAFNGSANVVLNASVDAGHITLARMADVATGTVFYRKTASTGSPEVQTLATLKTDLGLTGTNSGDQTITLTGDVTGSGTGSFAATIGNNVVSYAKMQDVSATNRFLGRITSGAGDAEELTGTQATSLLDTFTSGLKGLAPASGGGTSTFLRADGTWAAPPGGGTGLTNPFSATDVARFENDGTTVPAGSSGVGLELVGNAGGSAYITSYNRTAGALGALFLSGSAFVAQVNAATKLYQNGSNLESFDPVVVPDAAYGAGWDGSREVPTKNAVYDKIETLQPLDSDLTAIAALSTTAYGRALLTTVDQAALTAAIANATTSLAGTMSAADKIKVNNELTPVIYTATGSALGPSIADFFTSSISLEANSTYEITCHAYFLKSTAGTVTWTWAFSSAPIVATSRSQSTPVTGFTTTTITGAEVFSQATAEAAATLAHAASGSLTTAVRHSTMFTVLLRTNAATTIQLRATSSAGTVTPQQGSYLKARKII